MSSHLLHLDGMDEGIFNLTMECVDWEACDHSYVFQSDGSKCCDLVDWWDNVGNELLTDFSDNENDPCRFPTDPCFPVPVKASLWGSDGPSIVYDRPVTDRTYQRKSKP